MKASGTGLANLHFNNRQSSTMNSSLAKFKAGDLLCFNLSTAHVGGSLGEAKFRMASGKSSILKPSRTESGDYAVAEI